MKLNIVSNRKYWYSFSGLLIVASVIFVASIGLKFGIDFTGGSFMEVRFDQAVQVSDVRAKLAEAGYTNVSIQETDNNSILLRTETLDEEQHQVILATLGKLTAAEELRFDSIGPVVGNELRRTATIGVILTLILIGLYVAWAFRKVSEPVKSWKYGVLTILAALHDVIVAVGAFSIFGYFYGWEIGTAFVAAILTILGYSINDTVVIFDRTRENLNRDIGESFEQTVEMSIQQTLMRSLNTSLSTLLALLAVFLFGGESTRPFAMALIIGIATGTYSSIFFASPLLVTWELRKK